jgi:hypothetical protein
MQTKLYYHSMAHLTSLFLCFRSQTHFRSNHKTLTDAEEPKVRTHMNSETGCGTVSPVMSCSSIIEKVTAGSTQSEGIFAASERQVVYVDHEDQSC